MSYAGFIATVYFLICHLVCQNYFVLTSYLAAPCGESKIKMIGHSMILLHLGASSPAKGCCWFWRYCCCFPTPFCFNFLLLWLCILSNNECFLSSHWLLTCSHSQKKREKKVLWSWLCSIIYSEVCTVEMFAQWCLWLLL